MIEWLMRHVSFFRYKVFIQLFTKLSKPCSRQAPDLPSPKQIIKIPLRKSIRLSLDPALSELEFGLTSDVKKPMSVECWPTSAVKRTKFAEHGQMFVVKSAKSGGHGSMFVVKSRKFARHGPMFVVKNAKSGGHGPTFVVKKEKSVECWPTFAVKMVRSGGKTKKQKSRRSNCFSQVFLLQQTGSPMRGKIK